MLLINLAFKNVIRKAERSILTIIGILLAVTATMTLVSLSEGLHRRIQQEVSNRDADLYVSPKSAIPLPMGSIGPIGVTSEVITYKETATLGNLPNISVVAPIARIMARNQNTSLIFWGIEPGKFSQFFPNLHITEGRIFSERPDLVLGGSLAQQLNLKLGSTFTFGDATFSTVGITGKTGGFEEYFGYISLRQALRIQKTSVFQEVWLKLEDRHRIKETQKRIHAILPNLIARTPNEFLGVSIEFVQTTRLLQLAVAGIGILISIAASMNTMLMSTYERIKEFATLRAIGAPRTFAFSLVICESIILSTAGGILGVIVGLFTSYIFNEALVTLFQLSFPLALITPHLVGESLLISFGVGIMGAIIPAVIVYSMNLVKGLRWG